MDVLLLNGRSEWKRAGISQFIIVPYISCNYNDFTEICMEGADSLAPKPENPLKWERNETGETGHGSKKPVGSIACGGTAEGSAAALLHPGGGWESVEARICKALDGLEALIRHNESDIATWLPLEYELQKEYAHDRVECSPYLKGLRQAILRDTLGKIKDTENRRRNEEGA